MKKLLLTVLAIMATGAAYALPVGNPSEASLLCDGLFFEGHCGDPCDPCLTWCDSISLRFGFAGDYVFNRHLEVRDDGVDLGKIEHTEMFTNAGYFALNFWDRADIFTRLGVTNFRVEDNLEGTLAGRYELETNSAFSWSIGARGTIWECGCTTLGIEGEYFSTRPDIKRLTLDDIVSIYPDSNDDVRYSEWQVGVGISHRINMFVPYVAVKWSRAHGDFDDFPFGTLGTLPDVRNDKSWGYAVGVSLVDCEKAAITAEGRFADEKAFYVNGQIRF